MTHAPSLLVRRGRCPRSGAKRNKHPWGASPRRFRIIFRADRAVRPYNRLPYLRLILTLSFRASDRRHWRGNPFPFLCLRRPKAATYLCRSAAKARFDNRLQPRVGVSKGEGSQPLPFGRSRMGDFQGERKIETSFPLEWRSLDTFFRQGKKVSRRRQKERGEKESTPRSAKKENLSQHLLYFALPINPNTAGLQHRRRHAVPLGQRPGKRAVIDAPAPAGRASLLQHRRRAAI